MSDMHTDGAAMNDALAHLCILRALVTEDFDWYTSLTTEHVNKDKRYGSTYFFSYDDAQRDRLVIGLCVADSVVVRHVSSLLGLHGYVWYGPNSDPVTTYTVAEFHTLLTQDYDLVWYSRQ